MKKYTVNSSNGEIIIDAAGTVLETFDCSDNKCISGIINFDIAEWKKNYQTETLPDDGFDILDLGYWYNYKGKKQYEEPAHNWREENKKYAGQFIMNAASAKLFKK